MISVETILVAVISGLGGGLLGTWLQIRHERTEAFRARQIAAADDLATGLLQAMIGLGDAHSAGVKHGSVIAETNQIVFHDPETDVVPEEIDAALERSRELIGAAHARQARISLLFGPISPPDRAADLALSFLGDALDALEEWPAPDFERYHAARRKADRYLRDFNERALSEIQGRPWFSRFRIVVWIRRKWRWRNVLRRGSGEERNT